MYDKKCNIRPHWDDIVDGLENAGYQTTRTKTTLEIDWRLEDNGVTYNIYNDPREQIEDGI